MYLKPKDNWSVSSMVNKNGKIKHFLLESIGTEDHKKASENHQSPDAFFTCLEILILLYSLNYGVQ